MKRPGVSTDWKERVARARQSFDDSGTSIADWSAERGFSPSTVSEVLRGNRPCVRGQSHQIAVALGLKPAATAPAPIADAA